MSKQRLLVIVDALSERGPDTQRHIEQVFAQDVPLNSAVITPALARLCVLSTAPRSTP
jgi:hypothetical protein